MIAAPTKPRRRNRHANQTQWVCTTPALGVKNDPYNAPGARSVIIQAINHEYAQALALVHGLRLDGRLIK